MEIKNLEGQRWFIWTLVFLFVAGVGLTTYIYTSSSTASENDQGPFFVHHPKQVTRAHK